MIPINYNLQFPFDSIKPSEQVAILDYSLQKEGEWKKLLAITKNVIWIDHHKSAIEDKNAPKRLEGIRDSKDAACALTWKYFNRTTTPFVVRLIADHDTWTFNFGEETREFQIGIRSLDVHPSSELWRTLLRATRSDPMVQEILGNGKIISDYVTKENEYKIGSWAFEATFEGYNCICCNALGGSLVYGELSKDYDLMLNFIHDGQQYTFSIYTTKDIDVSEIAKKYGGGGHKGAAGFQIEKLPFTFKQRFNKE